MLLRASSLALALGLLACSPNPHSVPDAGGPTSPPVIRAFSAGPALLPHNGGVVHLQWEVSGADSLVLDPGGIDVTNQSGREVPISGNATFRLTARNALGAVQAEASVAVAGADAVLGRVLDEEGRPLPNLPVAIGSLQTTTAPDGSFLLSPVQAPYDVALTEPDLKMGIVYRGLTRPAPLATACRCARNWLALRLRRGRLQRD